MAKPLAGALAAVLLIAGMSFAQGSDAFVGTWKLNPGKSKFDPSRPPAANTVTVSEPDSQSITIISDIVDANGRTAHRETFAKFDGKEYPWNGVRGNQVRTFKRIDSRTFEFVTVVGGKAVATNKATVSIDGNTLTETETGETAQGRPVSNTWIFDRQ